MNWGEDFSSAGYLAKMESYLGGWGMIDMVLRSQLFEV